MTDKEKEAIEYVDYQVRTGNLLRGYTDIYFFQKELQVILAMLKEKDELYNKVLSDLVIAEKMRIEKDKELEKKDKIIDEMAEFIDTKLNNCLLNYLNIDEPCEHYSGKDKMSCKDCIKNYFEKESRGGIEK